MIIYEDYSTQKSRWEYTMFEGDFRNSPILGTLTSPKRKSIHDLSEWAQTTNYKMVIDASTAILYGTPHPTDSKAPNYNL